MNQIIFFFPAESPINSSHVGDVVASAAVCLMVQQLGISAAYWASIYSQGQHSYLYLLCELKNCMKMCFSHIVYEAQHYSADVKNVYIITVRQIGQCVPNFSRISSILWKI